MHDWYNIITEPACLSDVTHDQNTYNSIKGVFNLSDQLSNFSKNWGMQRDKTEFHEFHELILLRFCYSRSKTAIIPTIFSGKN